MICPLCRSVSVTMFHPGSVKRGGTWQVEHLALPLNTVFFVPWGSDQATYLILLTNPPKWRRF